MLSSRFIISFFLGAILLAWVIPSAWMNQERPLALEPLSPWKSAVSLEDVVWGGGTPYVRISMQNLATPIFLSGWSLENERGERAEIGLGVERIDTGIVPTPERIRVSSSTSLFVSFSPSPIGVSFQENLCSGYLRGTAPFAPPIEARCPDLSTHPRWGTLDATCQLFISSLPRCEVISPEHLVDMSPACDTFLRTIPTYASCVHEAGWESPTPTWRVFVSDRKDFIRENGGTIILKDDRGMVVDTLPYETIGI